jgi:hypothetical protein
MSTSAQLAMTRQNLNDAWWCEALFASGLQPSDAPSADMVAAAINRTVQQLGVHGCVGRMAQEFGDHPDAAARRCAGYTASPRIPGWRWRPGRMTGMAKAPDRWHRWLMDGRFGGGDPAARDRLLADIGLELRVTVKNGKRPVPWDRALRMSGNPLVPSLGEVLDRVLSPREIVEFTAHVKPLVESGTGRERQAMAYLAATRD